MEYSGRTPKEAIEAAQRSMAIEHMSRPDLAGGTFYAKENPLNHPMRRFTAGYIKGDHNATINYEDRVKANCNLVEGFYVIKNDIAITSWRQW